MKKKSIERFESPWFPDALPALRRARKRAEEIARQTGTALVIARNGRPVHVRPGRDEPRRSCAALRYEAAVAPPDTP